MAAQEDSIKGNKSFANTSDEELGLDRAETHPHKALGGWTKARGFETEVDEQGVRRTGGIWSGFALIITAVIGSGVLSLPNSLAMLGWVGGIVCLVIFAWITLYSSQLLADCHIVEGKRFRSYIEQVYTVMGPNHGLLITLAQQINLVLTALAYSITATYAMQNVALSVCAAQGIEDTCFSSFWKWALIHGGMQIFFSYIPDMDSSIWPCVLGAAMSFCYAWISIGRSVSELATTGVAHGSVGGISGLSTSAKTFGVMNSIGAILFAYSFSMILPEIQDTMKTSVKGGPIKAMRKAVNWSVWIMTFLYMAVAVLGYAAYGNDVAGNVLDSFVTPRWLVDCANIMVIVHLLPAYQVWSQPFFFYIETGIPRWFKGKEHWTLKGWWFRAWFRPGYVAVITFLTICMPFFNYIIGFVGAVGFWPATIFYPVRMWIKLYKPSATKAFWLEAMNLFCFIVTMVAIVGSVQSIVNAWTTFCFFCE